MRCSKCGTEMTALDSYRCPSCGKMTCLEHRMPDRHDCFSDDVLKGIEVKSLLGQSEETKPAASAARPSGEPRTFQRAQPSSEKKKKFGLF